MLRSSLLGVRPKAESGNWPTENLIILAHFWKGRSASPRRGNTVRAFEHVVEARRPSRNRWRAQKNWLP